MAFPNIFRNQVFWLVRKSIADYVDDDALIRGAAIAYYAVTSLAPLLLIVIAIGGLLFGEDAARGAITHQVGDLMGKPSAALLERVVLSAANPSSGMAASLVGITTLVVMASGVFGEMQSALNAIWRARPRGTTLSRLVRARLTSLGLVAALGFLLLVSLVVSAGLTALADVVDRVLPYGALILEGVNALVSFAFVAGLFAAIYKALPDRDLAWRDVAVGAAVTALLFTIGKSLLGLYLGSSNMASSYGAAGGLIILLVWIYYSAQIFLLGAEFTKAYATRFGSFRDASCDGVSRPNAAADDGR